VTDVPTSRPTMLAVWGIALSLIAAAALFVTSIVVGAVRLAFAIPDTWAVAIMVVGAVVLTVGTTWRIVGRGWKHRGH